MRIVRAELCTHISTIFLTRVHTDEVHSRNTSRQFPGEHQHIQLAGAVRDHARVPKLVAPAVMKAQHTSSECQHRNTDNIQAHQQHATGVTFCNWLSGSTLKTPRLMTATGRIDNNRSSSSYCKTYLAAQPNHQAHTSMRFCM
jgi:hypothetical protein